MKIKSKNGQIKIAPDLIEPEFGGICGMSIELKPKELPVLKVDMAIHSELDIQLGSKNTALRLIEFSASNSQGANYKEVAKIIYADGTEVNFLTTEEDQ